MKFFQNTIIESYFSYFSFFDISFNISRFVLSLYFFFFSLNFSICVFILLNRYCLPIYVHVYTAIYVNGKRSWNIYICTADFITYWRKEGESQFFSSFFGFSFDSSSPNAFFLFCLFSLSSLSHTRNYSKLYTHTLREKSFFSRSHYITYAPE